MTIVIHVQPVSSRTKLDVLREFGHRCFVEIGDEGKPIGYFVERKGEVALEQAKQKVRVRQRSEAPIVTSNHLVIITPKSHTFRPGCLNERVHTLCAQLAQMPTRRGALEQTIMEQTGHEKAPVTSCISRLLMNGYLKVFQ